MLKVGSVVLGVSDVRRAAQFWTQALGYVPREEIEDDWAVLVPAEGPGVQVALNRSETPVQPHPRVHLDLYAGDAADQAAEVTRLLTLGAHRVPWDLYPPRPRLHRPRRPGRQPLLRHRHLALRPASTRLSAGRSSGLFHGPGDGSPPRPTRSV